LFLFEFLLPWLAMFFWRWRTREYAPALSLFHIIWLVTSGFLVAGGAVYLLTALGPNASSVFASSVTTVGVVFLPLSLWGWAFVWDWIKSLGSHRFPVTLWRRSHVDS
jgi:hypothetical protein